MMLSLLMMLASDPVTAPPAPNNELRDRLRAIQQTQERCRNGAVIQTVDGRATLTVDRQPPAVDRVGASDLMFRSGDPLRRDLLVERTVDHCSVPISTELSAPGSALPRFGHGN